MNKGFIILIAILALWFFVIRPAKAAKAAASTASQGGGVSRAM